MYVYIYIYIYTYGLDGLIALLQALVVLRPVDGEV